MSKLKAKKQDTAQAGKSGIPQKVIYRWVVFLFSFLLYANSISYSYNMDDELVTRNHRLTSKGISAIPEIFTSPYYEDNSGYAYEYRPVVLTTFAIEHSIWGDSPAVSHFFNVVLYAVCCLLLFIALTAILHAYPLEIPLAIALIFSVHTAHTEVVASIKNRDEILALLFSVVTFLVVYYAKLREKKWLLLLVPVVFGLALMSKTTAISFAVIIPCILILFLEAGFVETIIVTLLLAVPSFIFINVPTGYIRFMVVVGIFAAVIAFYCLIHYKAVAAYLKQMFQRAVTLAKEGISVKTPQADNNSFSLTALIPDKHIFRLVYILPAVLLVAGCLLGIYAGYQSVSIISFLILLLMAWRTEGAWFWWANSALMLAVVLSSFAIPSTSFDINMYERITTFYVCYQLIYGRRDLLVVSATAFLIYLTRLHFSQLNMLDVISVFVGLLLCYNKYLRYLIAGFAVYVLVRELSPGNVYLLVEVARPVLILVVILSLQFKVLSTYTTRLFSWIVVVGLMILLNGDTAQANLTRDFGKVVVNTTNQVNPQLITKQDRPLHYTEQCVMPNDPITIRIGTSFEILFHYLYKTVLPYPLSFYYGYKFITPQKITDPIPLISLVLYAAIFILAVFLIRRNPLISFGLFVYLVSIVVFSGYFQYVPGMVGDRYMLVPSLGWSIVLVGILILLSGLKEGAKKLPWADIKPAAKYAFVAVMVLYTGLTFSRSSCWKDDITLFRHDIEYVDESAQAHNLLALHLMQNTVVETDPIKQRQITEEALLHFKKAQEIYPTFFNVAYDIGRVYSVLGKNDSALVAFENALNYDTLFPDVYLRLGDLYFQKQNLEKSNFYLRSFIRKQGNDYTGYNKLSYNLYLMKDYEGSLQVNREAAQRIPNIIDPYLNMARTFLEIKQTDSAYYYMQVADRMQPGNPEIQSSLKKIQDSMAKPGN